MMSSFSRGKSAIVSGAAGFVGTHLVKSLSDNGYCVYALVRPRSPHIRRICSIDNVRIVEADLPGQADIFQLLPKNCDFFFHLAWNNTDRYDYESQMINAYVAEELIQSLASLHCRRYVGIGSQAEYGATCNIIREDITPTKPFCGYGAAKIAACCLTKQKAKELGLEWVWGRIFSVYGEYEPKQRLIPHIMDRLERGEELYLSSCRQNWDFLFGPDAGDALMFLAEKGRDGEKYNIANGGYRPLRDYVDDIVSLYNSSSRIQFGKDPNPFVSLQPSVDKLKNDTGWYPKVSFVEGIRELMRMKIN